MPISPRTYIARINGRRDNFSLAAVAGNGDFVWILSVVNLDCEIVVLQEGGQDLIIMEVIGFLQEANPFIVSQHFVGAA